MTSPYPRSVADLAGWSRENGVPIAEARLRLAQFGALCAIASIPSLRLSLVFKGGNALDFVWQPNRSTRDLDFSLDPDGSDFVAGTDSLRDLLDQGLRTTTARLGITFAIHSVKQQPPGENSTFITYTARIGYGLPDEHQVLVRMANGQPSPHVLPIEISINEPIGASVQVAIDDRFPRIRVCTLEDIVGEKLRSLLQQPIRNRLRRQDVLDIAMAIRGNPELDRSLVAEFLTLKAKARDVPVSKASFMNPEVAERARVDYTALEPTTRTAFIPFDEAFALVLSLVDDLPISDR